MKYPPVWDKDDPLRRNCRTQLNIMAINLVGMLIGNAIIFAALAWVTF